LSLACSYLSDFADTRNVFGVFSLTEKYRKTAIDEQVNFCAAGGRILPAR